jgi:hypothetical protein
VLTARTHHEYDRIQDEDGDSLPCPQRRLAALPTALTRCPDERGDPATQPVGVPGMHTRESLLCTRSTPSVRDSAREQGGWRRRRRWSLLAATAVATRGDGGRCSRRRRSLPEATVVAARGDGGRCPRRRWSLLAATAVAVAAAGVTVAAAGVAVAAAGVGAASAGYPGSAWLEVTGSTPCFGDDRRDCGGRRVLGTVTFETEAGGAVSVPIGRALGDRPYVPQGGSDGEAYDTTLEPIVVSLTPPGRECHESTRRRPAR